MSRRGNCLDDAPMEVRPLSRTDGVRGLTYHTLKVERVHHRLYARNEARKDLFG